MSLLDRIRDTDNVLDIALPGRDAQIYEEVSCGATWLAAGLSVGITGTDDVVEARARRLAMAYARLYRKPDPLEVSRQAEVERVQDAVRAAAERERVEEARRAAEVQAERDRIGKLLYEARRETSSWTTIAKQVGVPYRHSRDLTRLYAIAYKLPWPPPRRTVDLGKLAYERHVTYKEPWEAVAEHFDRDSNHIRRAAKLYALRVGLPWPVRLHDHGPDAYRLYYEEGLSWDDVAARLHIRRSWAIHEAHRHRALTHPSPLFASAEAEERAYELRASRRGWKEICGILGCVYSAAIARAQRHAEATGKPWPIKVPPVRTAHSPQAKQAYERGYVQGESWSEVATSLGYRSVASAKTSARCYADSCRLPLDVQRRKGSRRILGRQEQAYHIKQQCPDKSWMDVGNEVGYPTAHSAATAARVWSRKQGLPWPIVGGSDG